MRQRQYASYVVFANFQKVHANFRFLVEMFQNFGFFSRFGDDSEPTRAVDSNGFRVDGYDFADYDAFILESFVTPSDRVNRYVTVFSQL